MNRLREVWANNLEQEMSALRDAVDQYPYIAVKTEFPGIVARPIGNFKTNNEFNYQTMRCNVELLKVIQIGFTLCDPQGNFVPEAATWQFNFRFDLEEDMYAPDSIDGLRLGNMDFARHQELGIDPIEFAELLITSGLVLFDEVTWLSYASQNDMGYLLKTLTNAPLPPVEADFRDLLAIWFPKLYDVKYIMKITRPIKVGLQELSDEFGVARIGPTPAAGGDSHLIAGVYFKIRNAFFAGEDPEEAKFNGQIYGIAGDSSFTPTGMNNSPTNVMSHQPPNMHNSYAAQAMAYGMYR